MQHAFPQHTHASPYEILGLPRSADSSTIKDRYYELAKLYHPDSPNPVGPHIAKARYRLISDAYTLLKDPVTKQAYLRNGSGWASLPDRSVAGSSTPSERSRDSPHRTNLDPFHDWGPEHLAEYSGYSAQRWASAKQAFDPGSEWTKRTSYSQSADEASRRARFVAAAVRDARRRQDEADGTYSSVRFSPTAVRVASAATAFAALCVTLAVASRSSVSPPLEALVDAPAPPPGTRSTASESHPNIARPTEWIAPSSASSTSTAPISATAPESTLSSATFEISSLPSASLPVSSLSGSSSFPSDLHRATAESHAIKQADLSRREQEAEERHREALRKRQLILRDEPRGKTFARD